jgi:hypothetical protein
LSNSAIGASQANPWRRVEGLERGVDLLNAQVVTPHFSTKIIMPLAYLP